MKSIFFLVASVISASSSAMEGADKDVQMFKQTVACEQGRLTTENSTYAQCAMSQIGAKASISVSSDGTRDITITIDGDSAGNYSETQTLFLVTMIQQSVELFGGDSSVSEYFLTMPLSPDVNKATLVKGVKFYIPSAQSVASYNNYQLSMVI